MPPYPGLWLSPDDDDDDDMSSFQKALMSSQSMRKIQLVDNETLATLCVIPEHILHIALILHQCFN